jgi:hypothetical protein
LFTIVQLLTELAASFEKTIRDLGLNISIDIVQFICVDDKKELLAGRVRQMMDNAFPILGKNLDLESNIERVTANLLQRLKAWEVLWWKTVCIKI